MWKALSFSLTITKIGIVLTIEGKSYLKRVCAGVGTSARGRWMHASINHIMEINYFISKLWEVTETVREVEWSVWIANMFDYITFKWHIQTRAFGVPENIQNVNRRMHNPNILNTTEFRIADRPVRKTTRKQGGVVWNAQSLLLIYLNIGCKVFSFLLLHNCKVWELSQSVPTAQNTEEIIAIKMNFKYQK